MRPTTTGRLLTLVTTMVLAGCATSDDPHAGGFISGAQNLATGGYEKRIKAREGELRDEQAQEALLTVRAAEIRREREKVAARLAEAETRLGALERKIKELKAEIAGEKSERSAEWARLQEVETGLVELHAAVDRVHKQEAPVEQSLQEVEEIQSVLNSLSTLVEELSAGGAL